MTSGRGRLQSPDLRTGCSRSTTERILHDSGGIEPFEFFEVEDKDLLGLFAQGLIEAGDRLERKTADQRDRFQARA